MDKNEVLDNSAEEVVEETVEAEEEETVEEEEAVEEKSEDSDLQAQLEQLRKDNGILRRKLTKAEKQDKQESQKPVLTDSLTVEKVQEIARLSAKYSPEEIEELDYIAAREGITSSEAEKTTRFKTFREALEREAKAKEASLGASNSSGSRKKAKDFSSSGLSAEEHRKLWEKRRRA